MVASVKHLRRAVMQTLTVGVMVFLASESHCAETVAPCELSAFTRTIAKPTQVMASNPILLVRAYQRDRDGSDYSIDLIRWKPLPAK